MTVNNFDDKDNEDDNNTSDDEYSIEEEIDDPRNKNLFNELTLIKKDVLYDQI